MRYELVTTADEERGEYVTSLTEAIRRARAQGCDVWLLADDAYETRVCRVWPPTDAIESVRRWKQNADAYAAAGGGSGAYSAAWRTDPADKIGTGAENVTPILSARADRIASGLLAEHTWRSRAEVHALVALAYAMGDRDGYTEAARDAGKFLRAAMQGRRT